MFLKVGSTAFGGFMALISVVESLVVQRRKLLTHDDMLDGISLASILPGPVAVNVVAYVGYRLRGGLGALATAAGVLLPTFLLMVGFTIAYLQMGDIPQVRQALMGFIPAMTAIILAAAWRLGCKTIPSWREGSIAIVAALALLFVKGSYTTLAVVVLAGLVGWLWFRAAGQDNPNPTSEIEQHSDLRSLLSGSSKFKLLATVGLLSALFLLFLFPPSFLGTDSLAKIFTTFSGMSLMLFGSGYVFIPLIQDIVVNQLGWVTPEQFTTAIAIGQVTPGPILISAAFIGYVVKGFLGAVVATIGIFFPPALLMVACSTLLASLKQSSTIQAALRGIRPAVIGMIVAAAVVFIQTASWHWATPAIFVAAAIALFRFKADVLAVIPAAGVLGLLLY
jgi:chromate transporter